MKALNFVGLILLTIGAIILFKFGFIIATIVAVGVAIWFLMNLTAVGKKINFWIGSEIFSFIKANQDPIKLLKYKAWLLISELNKAIDAACEIKTQLTSQNTLLKDLELEIYIIEKKAKEAKKNNDEDNAKIYLRSLLRLKARVKSTEELIIILEKALSKAESRVKQINTTRIELDSQVKIIEARQKVNKATGALIADLNNSDDFSVKKLLEDSENLLNKQESVNEMKAEIYEVSEVTITDDTEELEKAYKAL